MASEQVMLRLLALLGGVALLVLVTGCGKPRPAVLPAPRLVSPYAERQVWAVVPLRNESGSRQADGIRVADQLAQQLEQADGIDVIPVSRVLSALQTLRLEGVSSPREAMDLRRVLGVDALVVGSLSAFDPYDPPKIGLALELYTAPRQPDPGFNPRDLSRAGTEEHTRVPDASPTGQPVSAISVYMDAADPSVRSHLDRYVVGRGRETRPSELRDARMYRLSIDLYTEFVSYAVSSRLLRAERQRLKPHSPRSPS